MRVLLNAIISLAGYFAAATFTGAKLQLDHCADVKTQNPTALAIVAVVSSIARDSTRRFELRRTDFRDAQSLASRTAYRPAASVVGTTSGQSQHDSRAVCVQPLFVISPWIRLASKRKHLSQDDWRKLAAESHEHEDVLISPVMINAHTTCLLYTSPSPRDRQKSRMPSSA